jgi:hypothetical protein
MQRIDAKKFDQDAPIRVFADFKNERLCACGCGESLAGERKNKLYKTGHKDKYYYRKKKEKMETIKRNKEERNAHLLRSYKHFKENHPFFLRHLYSDILVEYEPGGEKLSIRLAIELVKHRYKYRFSNSYQKLIRADLLKLYPEMKEYLK